MADGGKYRGARNAGADYFDDVMGNNTAPAMFATDMGGIEDYEKVTSEVNPNGLGIMVTMHCRPPGCGKPRTCEISWAELFIVAHAPQTGFLPPGWRMSEVNHAPCPGDLACNCGRAFEPMIMPDWAAKQVGLAMQGGIVTQQQLMGDPTIRQIQMMMQQRQQGQGATQLPQQMPPNGWWPGR